MKPSPLIATLALAALGSVAQAQSSPVGLWKTMEPDGKSEPSLVRISDNGGTLSGTITKLFDPARQQARCGSCSGERQNQPLLGLTIVQGLHADPLTRGTWSGGEVLDPDSGRTFRLRMTPHSDGQTMEVRGYDGMLYRSHVWQRVE